MFCQKNGCNQYALPLFSCPVLLQNYVELVYISKIYENCKSVIVKAFFPKHITSYCC
jgi:hypothetical protein